MGKWTVLKARIRYFLHDLYYAAIGAGLLACALFAIPSLVDDAKAKKAQADATTETEIELSVREDNTVQEHITTTTESTTTTEEVTTTTSTEATTTTEVLQTEEPQPELVHHTESDGYRRDVTEEEYRILLRVCMSEAGGRNGEPMDGKVAVIVTLLNRVDMGYGTISQVAYSSYSTANNGEPDETCVEAVERALTGQHDFPSNLFAFRTGDYHSFGYHYKQIGNHFFSCVD